MNIVNTIKENLDGMTKSEYKVAVYCLSNLKDFAFDTLDTIAEKIDISTTSVIRFCRRLGFPGYKSFQEEVRSGFKYEPDLPDKFKRNLKNTDGNNIFSKAIEKGISCIEKTFSELPYERFYECIDILGKANRVFCFGMKESFALAHYAYTRFLTVRDNVFMLSAGYNGEIESILSLNEKDVCVVFLFHRYTKQSLKILEVLKKQNVRIILVTSPPFDTIEGKSDVLIPCYVDVDGIKNSALSPVCLADCLCNTLATVGGEKTLEYMKKSEQLFKDFIF
ncbi:MAG: MurR/RpiR family transcriptional regulator [Clostridia bacterium]|nr:MurR/RpiR family transcriptional regulator [Clostridia bacterium]